LKLAFIITIIIFPFELYLNSFATKGVEVYNMFSETAIKDYCKSLILKYAIGALFQYLPYSVLSESRGGENFEVPGAQFAPKI